MRYGRFRINKRHFEFLSNETTLKLRSAKSLDERCILFNRKFPLVMMTRAKLRQLYRLLYIRKKIIRRTKLVTREKLKEIHKNAIIAYN